MKRIFTLILLITILLLSVCACGSNDIKIENYSWTLRYAMHIENQQVVYDAVDSPDTTHPDAKTVDVTLTAANGKFTVKDTTNGKTYEGTYTKTQRTPEGTDYRITIDGKDGYATVAMTTYADGSEEPTLPINLDGYSLYFYAPIKR